MPIFDLNEPLWVYSALEEDGIICTRKEVPCSGMAQGELVEPMRKKPYPFTLASSGLPSNCRSELNKSGRGNLSNTWEETCEDGQKLSTVEIIRVAAERYVQLSTKQDNGGLTMSIHPYGYALSGLSQADTGDVELVHLLLDSAEKVGCQQYNQANGLLTRCEWMASDSGNPVQRIAFYFAESLRERIDKETGRISKRSNEETRARKSLALGTNLANLACYQEIPFNQAMQFAATQTIIDNVSMATKIHLIDLCIRSGVQWTAFMQALAEQRNNCPIELLKITTIGTTDKQSIEVTGKRLFSFANSLNLSLSFNVVFVSDIKDLKEEMFDIEADEELVVYSSFMLRTLLSSPDSLEYLIGLIRRLNPSLMVVTEVEGNHNSPLFVNRFIEALFFYGAYFDCLENCWDRDNEYRMIIEGIHLGNGIQDMVATEGKERFHRNVKMDVWRAFFTRFGMEEIEFSESSLYQAILVLKRFACGRFCNLDTIGKSLIVGWKGTPIHSLSSWKFL